MSRLVSAGRAAGRVLLAVSLPFFLAPTARSQLVPPSGVFGVDLVYATSPQGTSQLFALAPMLAASPLPIGAPVPATPSRWAHRRRTLGALETALLEAEPLLFATPMGTQVGDGSIHFVDARTGLLQTQLVPTHNPAAYDLVSDPSLHLVFSVEDDGAGHTLLRGFDVSTPGTVSPTNPPTLQLAGPPAAYVNRIGFDADAHRLQVATTTGVSTVQIQAQAPQMALLRTHSTGTFVPVTNPAACVLGGVRHWFFGLAAFDPQTLEPTEAGWLAFDANGQSWSGSFGDVAASPPKKWVPAVGAEELALVSDGQDAYAYLLLREPPPGTFYIKPGALGAVHFSAQAAPQAGTVLCTPDCGEPFAIPTVSGTRVAFESSFGPPFVYEPPGGGEKVNLLYTPLDPFGSGPFGTLAVPGPLGGRISTKGMDRPLWDRADRRVVAATSHFPGAPNPFHPGIEVLDVPTDVPVGPWTAPHQVVPIETFPARSIVFPSDFRPRDPGAAAWLAGFSFVGNVFHTGMASVMLLPFGEVGQHQVDAFDQSPAIPNFPALLPPTFDDPNGSLVTPPASFGARRTTWNLAPNLGFDGLLMSAALGDRVVVQPSGHNFVSAVLGAPQALPTSLALPSGWITTTEFLSL